MRDRAYRFYVTDALSLAPQNKYISQRYADMIKPHKIDNRSGDEIAMDIISRHGLKVKNNGRI